MPQRPSRLLYILIAAVAALSLVHAVAGAIGNVETILSEKTLRPFDTKFGTPVVATALEQTRRAGLQAGDTVLAINGQPYTGFAQVFAVTREVPPGAPITITFRRGPAGQAVAQTIQVAAVGQGNRTVWGQALQVFFLVLPLLALLTGLYVLLARPGTFVAWLVFAILAYSAAVFFSVQFMPPALVPAAMVWAEIDETMMPVALLLFAIHFPDRASFDRRYPWVKWVLIAPQLLLFPMDLAAQYEGLYHVPVAVWLATAHERAQPVETVASVGSILLFFALLGTRMGTSTGDARRRLRVLYYGAIAGLAPVFLLVILSTVRRTRFAEGVPEALKLIAISMLLILPVSLAYVVVVQRAMELRILVRQGTKYFFARQSVAVVRIALTVWMAWALTKFSLHPERRRLIDVAEVLGVIVLFAAYRLVLGGRLQQWVDRRFFRDAYSAEQVLSELSDEARNFTEVEPLLTTVTERIGATLHIERIAVFLRTGESFVLQLATGSAPAMPALALPAGSATITTLTREKRPSVLYRDDPQSWLVEATDAERRALQDLSAELLVPLPGRHRLLGVMTLGPKRSEEPYSRTDRQLLQSVASQTGLALENAELLETLTVEIAQRETHGERDRDRARGAGAALSAELSRRSGPGHGGLLPSGAGGRRGLLRHVSGRGRGGAHVGPAGARGRRYLGQGHLGLAADGVAARQPAQPGAHGEHRAEPRSRRADAAGQSTGLRGVDLKSLCDVLLRGVRARHARADLCQRRSQPAGRSARRCGPDASGDGHGDRSA